MRGCRVHGSGDKDKALKVAWVYKAQRYPDIKNLAYSVLRNPVGILIWSLHIAQGDLHYLTRAEGFWKQVLEYWSELHYCAPLGEQEVKDTIIWFNSDVRVQFRPVSYRTFYEAGINQVSDLLLDDKKFLTYEQFCLKYAINPSFMQ